MAIVAPRSLGRCVRVLAVAATLSASPANAAEPSETADASSARTLAASTFAAAERAHEACRFAEALAAYRRAIALDPSARFSSTARSKADDLEAHAEGDFVPLTKLIALRRDRSKSSDRPTIEAFERELATFPAGRVRSESALLVAEAWWHKLSEPSRAIAPLESVLIDVSADQLTRSLALSELVTIQRELNDLDAARALVERYPDLAPGTRAEVLTVARRETLRAVALGSLALLLLIGLTSILHAARKRRSFHLLRSVALSPGTVAFALYLGGAAAILVRLRGDGDPRPFLWLGIGVLAVLTIARTWALTSTDRRAHTRIARALICAIGVIAAAFLAVERTDASYLGSIGL